MKAIAVRMKEFLRPTGIRRPFARENRPGELVHNARKRRVDGTMGEGFKPTEDAA